MDAIPPPSPYTPAGKPGRHWRPGWSSATSPERRTEPSQPTLVQLQSSARPAAPGRKIAKATGIVLPRPASRHQARRRAASPSPLSRRSTACYHVSPRYEPNRPPLIALFSGIARDSRLAIRELVMDKIPSVLVSHYAGAASWATPDCKLMYISLSV